MLLDGVILLTSSVGSCVAILPTWRIVLFVRHTCPCSESSAVIFIAVRGGSCGSVMWCGCASCGLACRHEPVSLTDMRSFVHPIWCIYCVLFGIRVTLEAMVLRSPMTRVDGPFGKWGRTRDHMWGRAIMLIATSRRALGLLPARPWSATRMSDCGVEVTRPVTASMGSYH